MFCDFSENVGETFKHMFEVVVPATTTLVEFIERPGIPTMLVDAFINSHGASAS